MMKFRDKKGFSLVELMIVVAIIAILAAIAIPSFMRFAMKSKTSEATGNLSAIRTAEEGYKAENDLYYVCVQSPAIDATDLVTSAVKLWVDEGTPGEDAFEDIGFAADGNVRYHYEVPTASATGYVATATGDLDDDNLDAIYTLTKTTPLVAGNPYPKPVLSVDDF